MGVKRLYILPHGRIEHDANFNEFLATRATVANKEACSRWMRVPSFSLLIEHDIGWIQVDTGPPPEALSDDWPLGPYMPWVGSKDDLLEAQLSKLELTPSDISLLVLTHLHWDHAGGLRAFAGTKAGGRVLVPRDDFAHALILTHIGSNDPIPQGYVKYTFADVPGICYEPVDGDYWLADGIELLTLHGQTPALFGLVIQLNGKTIIYPSDSIIAAFNYGPPTRPPGGLYDSRGFEESVQRIRALERRLGARILFPHDWSQFKALHVVPRYYE